MLNYKQKRIKKPKKNYKEIKVRFYIIVVYKKSLQKLNQKI